MTSPLYLAIDTTHLDAALTLAQKVRRHVGGLKLGLEFFCANGHHGVHEMAKLGLPIFLDLKLHDIPNTVAKAIQALRPLEPAILTVHAAGGRAMLEEAKAAAGLIDLIRNGKFSAGQRVLFWHTGGAVALFGYDKALTA